MSASWTNDIRELKLSYRNTYWNLRRSLKRAQAVNRDDHGQLVEHPDVKVLKQAISDINYSIQWMHTGRRPGNKRGVERRAGYQREKLMDPVRMQAFVSQSSAGSASNLSEYERHLIEDALSRLSTQERACYEMVHGQAYTLAYTAKTLGIERGSVESYVKRAHKKISADVNCKLVMVCE